MTTRQTLTPELIELVRLFNRMDSGVHGILHIWLDDGNSERKHVAWLAGEARHGHSWQHDQYPVQTGLGAYIARIAALYLTNTQRGKLYSKHGWDDWLKT